MERSNKKEKRRGREKRKDESEGKRREKIRAMLREEKTKKI